MHGWKWKWRDKTVMESVQDVRELGRKNDWQAPDEVETESREDLGYGNQFVGGE